MAALAQLGAALEESGRAEEVAVALVTHVRDELGFRRAVALVHGRELWRGASTDADEGLLFAREGAFGDVADDCMGTAEPRLVRSLEAGHLADAIPNASNVVLAPLVCERGARGVIAAEWGGGARARVPATTVQALEAASAQAGRALDRQARLDEVAELATRDAVTGLANRQMFDETLGLELARAHRQSTPLSLIVLDIDRFKGVNDTGGHRLGDEVLRRVGTTLVSCTKGSDLAARYGGDEFVVLLPGCPRHEAVKVAERLRAAVAGEFGGVPVTLSAGVATVPDDTTDGDGLVAAADAALYLAKREGRDRTAQAPA